MLPFSNILKINIFLIFRIIIFIFFFNNEIKFLTALDCTLSTGSKAYIILDYDTNILNSPTYNQICSDFETSKPCPDDYPFYYKYGEKELCVKDCDHINRAFYSNNNKVYHYFSSKSSSSINKKKCSLNCIEGDDKQYKDFDSKRCVTNCTLTYNKYHYLNDDDNQCYNKCNYRLENSYLCIRGGCPTGKPNKIIINDDGENICYDECPKHNGKMFVKGGNCVECKDSTEGFFVRRVINPVTENEDTSKPQLYYDIYKNNICYSGCPNGYKFYRYNDNECLFSYGKGSCDQIPDNIFKFYHPGRDKYICLEKCISKYKYVKNTYECHQFSSCENYFYEISNLQYCLTELDDCRKIGNYYFYGTSKRCEKSCTNDYDFRIFHELDSNGNLKYYGQCLNDCKNENIIDVYGSRGKSHLFFL